MSPSLCRLVRGFCGRAAGQRFAAQAADVLLEDTVPDPGVLNDLARDSSARVQLTASNGSFQQELTWEDASAAGQLARRLIGELAALDSSRLRRCAREQCALLFYDSTRSRTSAGTPRTLAAGASASSPAEPVPDEVPEPSRH